MTFWIAAAALLGLTCLALLLALARRPAPSGGHDRAFYEAQIAEIDRQLSLRLIGDREAESARTEAARRLLAAASEHATALHPDFNRKVAAVAILIIVPALAMPVYLARGAPDMPSFPLAARERPAPGGPQQIDLASALQQIEAHLTRNPEDGRGHEVAAPVQLRMGRTADAVRSFATALRILGPTADRHANLGEALTLQAEGIVTAEATAAFAAAAALDAKHAKARFFLAMAAQQDGDQARAAALFAALRDDLPDGELKAEIARRLAPPSAAVASLPAGEQQAAIRSMVEGLAQRLATSGGTAEEWSRLIRALVVLEEADRARAILSEARQKFAAEPEALKRLEEAGRGL